MVFKSPFKGSNVKNEILNFIKTYLTRETYIDIKAILEPCCKPTLALSGNYTCTVNSYTVLQDVEVFTSYKNKKAKLLFTFVLSDGTIYTASESVTLDSNGHWIGNVTTLHYISDGIATITVSVILEDSKVLITSDSITVTDIPNCD